MVLFKVADRSLGLVSTLILVRLLSPADFGIVAMALFFVSMAEFFSAFGFDIALIHLQNPTDEHYHTAWTCNMLLGCAITIFLLAIAQPVALFYGQAEVFWVLCMLAFGPFLASLENIGIVKFRKDLQFRREFNFRMSRRFFTFFVTLPLAFWLQNYWALVGSILLSKLGSSGLSYIAQEFRPRFCLVKIKELFGFSKWLLINNFIGFLKEHSADFIIGRFLGPVSLGLYNISYEVSNMPTSELSASINRALLPGFAKIGADNELSVVYKNVIGILALVALPAASGVYAIAPFLVPIALGIKWLESIALVEILVFNGALLLFHSSICSILIAKGYPLYVAKTNFWYLLFLLGLLGVLVTYYGIFGAACAVLGTSVIMTPVYLYQMKRRIGIKAELFFRASIRPVLASAIMVMIVRWILPVYGDVISVQYASLLLICGVALGAAVYATALVSLWLIAGRPIVSAEYIVFERIRSTLASSVQDKTLNSTIKR